jgi:hypothetical protein
MVPDTCERLRQEDWGFKASLGYIVSKNKNKKSMKKKVWKGSYQNDVLTVLHSLQTPSKKTQESGMKSITSVTLGSSVFFNKPFDSSSHTPLCIINCKCIPVSLTSRNSN